MRTIVTYPASDARDVTTEVDVPWSACTEPLGFDIEFMLDPACTSMHHQTVEGGGFERLCYYHSVVLVYGDAFKGAIKLLTWSNFHSPRISSGSVAHGDEGVTVYDAVALGVIPCFGMAPCASLHRVRLTWTLSADASTRPVYDLGLSQLSASALGASVEFERRNNLRVCRIPEPRVVELRGVEAVGAFRREVGGSSPHGWVVIKTSAQHCICVELWEPWDQLFKKIPYGVARELDTDNVVVFDTSELATTISADVARAFVWRWACGMTWDMADLELCQTFADMAEWMGALQDGGSNRWWNCRCC